MKPNHVIATGVVLVVIVVAIMARIRPDPLSRLSAIEQRLSFLKTSGHRVTEQLIYSMGLLNYPTDEARLMKLWEDEARKQVSLGNLLTLRFPTEDLPAGYFKTLGDVARTNLKHGLWSFTTDPNQTQLLITTPPFHSNDWLRLVAEVRSAH